MVTGLQRDQGRKLILVSKSQLKTDIAPHGLSHDYRLMQFKGAAELDDKFGIKTGGQLVFIFLKVPTGRRQGFSMSRDIEHDSPEIPADIRIA